MRRRSSNIESVPVDSYVSMSKFRAGVNNPLLMDGLFGVFLLIKLNSGSKPSAMSHG